MSRQKEVVSNTVSTNMYTEYITQQQTLAISSAWHKNESELKLMNCYIDG